MEINKEELKEARREKIREKNRLAKSKEKKPVFKSHGIDEIFVRGVYYLYDNEAIVYVGISMTNVMERLVKHHKDKDKIFTHFSFKEYTDVSDKQLRGIERKLIKRHKPKYNKVHNTKTHRRSKSVYLKLS